MSVLSALQPIPCVAVIYLLYSPIILVANIPWFILSRVTARATRRMRPGLLRTGLRTLPIAIALAPIMSGPHSCNPIPLGIAFYLAPFTGIDLRYFPAVLLSLTATWAITVLACLILERPRSRSDGPSQPSLPPGETQPNLE